MNALPPGGPGSGLFVSLRRFAATALELGQVRLELLCTEIEQQKLRILTALVWAALGVLLIGFGMALLAGLVVLLMWDNYRLHALGALVLMFVAGGLLLLRMARNRIQSPAGAFAASSAELTQDRAALMADAERGPAK